MITSIAFAISTTSVTAEIGTPEVEITPEKVAGQTTKVYTLTIKNAGPNNIDNVLLTVPSSFTGLAPVVKIPKDNEVTLEDNKVTLSAGTLIKLGACTLKAVENTRVTIPSGTKIRWKPAGDNVDGLLSENLDAKIIENFPISNFAENVRGTGDIVITLESEYGTARLLEDTLVVLGADNKVRLPEDTTVQLVIETTATIGVDNQVTLENKKVVDLGAIAAENTISPPGDNTGRIFVALTEATTNTIYKVGVDDNVLVWDVAEARSIAFPAGTEFILDNDSTATIFDNTEVIRAANENVKMTADTVPNMENVPAGWATTTIAPTIRWQTTGTENMIGSGATKVFKFAMTSPAVGGDYTTFQVDVEDDGGDAPHTATVYKTITVDNVAPVITAIDITPDPAKDNTVVTITLTANETLAKLENVMVAENGATENTQITMTPNADNTVWTGTYTTGDNIQRDGLATVYVIGAQIEDTVGTTQADDNTPTFTIDRVKPPTPSTTYGGLTFSLTSPTNEVSLTISGTTVDNTYYGGVENVAGMTVKIRKGTATPVEVVSGADDAFVYTVTLSEGANEIGVSFVDKAGNVGDENVENFICDTVKPSITITSPATTYINDNTPTIKVTIADATLGVENYDYGTGTNPLAGYTVTLRDDENDEIDNLVNALAWDRNTLNFENQYPTERVDNWYNIYVIAGDNHNYDNAYFRFYIDTKAPTVPSPGTENPLKDTTLISPKVRTSTTLTLTGSGAVAGVTVKVYLAGATTPAGTATVDSAGRWTVSVTLTAGTTTMVEVTMTDEAGNESARKLYGYALADGTAPTVTITAPELGISTDATSIMVEATVTKDTWEQYSVIVVRIDATSLTAPLTLTNVLDTEGKMSRAVQLVEGTNTISVSAQDEAGNWSTVETVTVTRSVTPWATYAIIIVIVALILAAIAIFRKR